MLLLLASGCTNASEPSGIAAPTRVVATALGRTAVRVTWAPPDDGDVTSYEIQRRRDFVGPFETLSDAVRSDGAALVTYFDSSVEPDHFYGYRVRALDRFGARSALSNVAGARTAAEPGVLVRTTTTFVTPSSADADGFVVSVRGPRDTTSFNVPINGQRLVSPLPRGSYSVVLRGLAINCNPTTLGDTMKTAQVTDEGLNTVGNVTFSISCRDPQKASIVATVRTSGDTLDADGVVITVSGIIREAGTPANERVFFQSRTLLGAEAATRFDDLRPGDYEVVISDIEAPCVLEGERRRMLQPRALAVDTVPFTLTCRRPAVPVDTAARPFVVRQTWSASSARPGDRVSLLTSVDLRARPAVLVSGVSATTFFDNRVVRFDSARTTRAFDITANNQPQPGILIVAAIQVDSDPLGGDIAVIRSWFTVVGAAGALVSTATTVTDLLSDSQQRLTAQTRVVEGTLTINANGGGANQPPTAVITGPTTGVVGTSLAFSGAQSTDPDGSIASYAWNFGDGQTRAGATVANSYSAAGTFIVRLTVTDNQGATASRDQQVVITVPAPTAGSVTGSVTSSLGGGISGTTVSLTGGAAATTGGGGNYTLTNVPAGVRTLTVSGVPAGCTVPAAQTVTVSAGATTTANFIVTCTNGNGSGNGSLQGRVTRAGDGSGIGFVRVTALPSGGVAVAPVQTTTDGGYAIASVPVGSGGNAGTGTLTVTDLPAGCATPAPQPYIGLSANASLLVNISVTCAASTTGTLTGRITRSTGGDAAGVGVTVIPSGGTALPAVSTISTGVYSVANVPAGGGSLTLGNLPNGCTAPSNLSYAGITAGGTITRDVALNCVAAAQTYPLTSTFGAITSTGPTGRQVTLTVAIDMGGAPGRLDVTGADADLLAAIAIRFEYDSTRLVFQSRTLLSPDEFDLGVQGTVNGTGVTRITTVAVASTSAQLKGGAFSLVRLTFNIRAGVTGSVPMSVTIAQALAGTSPAIDVTSSVVVQPLPPLVIPP